MIVVINISKVWKVTGKYIHRIPIFRKNIWWDVVGMPQDLGGIEDFWKSSVSGGLGPIEILGEEWPI